MKTDTKTPDGPATPAVLIGTYSPEDNKLRIYAFERLEDDVYARVKARGFNWAPKQKLFVCPRWTPEAEDLATELCGEIVPEGVTMAERAEAKAERLDNLRTKRLNDANRFFQTAAAVGERFAGGQPILVGHHSERKARRDQKTMHTAERNGIEAMDTANYWAYKAEGVERHANHKNAAGTRARRIKTLLAELRGWQRRINFSARAVALWREVAQIEDAEERREKTLYLAGYWTNEGRFACTGACDGLKDGTKTPAQVITEALELHGDCSYGARWIAHLLNRLGFERSQLGPVPRFEGEFTAAILQTFARTQGADKPKATKTSEGWELKSPVPLPVHIHEEQGARLELTADGWRDLMESTGYTVEIKAPRKSTAPPLLNYRIPEGETIAGHTGNMYRSKPPALPQVAMTRAQYKRIHAEARETAIVRDTDPVHRVKTVFLRRSSFEALGVTGHGIPDKDGWGSDPHARRAVFLTDAKEHARPAAPKKEAAV